MSDDFDDRMRESGEKVEELARRIGEETAWSAAAAAMAVDALKITSGIADAVDMAGRFEEAMREIAEDD